MSSRQTQTSLVIVDFDGSQWHTIAIFIRINFYRNNGWNYSEKIIPEKIDFFFFFFSENYMGIQTGSGYFFFVVVLFFNFSLLFWNWRSEKPFQKLRSSFPSYFSFTHPCTNLDIRKLEPVCKMALNFDINVYSALCRFQSRFPLYLVVMSLGCASSHVGSHWPWWVLTHSMGFSFLVTCCVPRIRWGRVLVPGTGGCPPWLYCWVAKYSIPCPTVFWFSAFGILAASGHFTFYSSSFVAVVD